MTAQSTTIKIDGPANGLAINKDGSRVAVVGRSIYKILSVDDNQITEILNLRPPKSVNLNFSSTDVAWSPLDDNILATSATNGAVVTWNLTMNSRTKKDLIFNDHKRTVNRVVFHSTEPNIILTGSQDGTMKLFDIRRKECALTFDSQTESVRDVQFSPHTFYCFAAVQENGNVQIWDSRVPARPEKQFTAHNGPIFTCDWNLDEPRWLATGGRDKTIKVWDTSQAKPPMDHVIQTIASVARVKWRPERRFNIASCSLVVDFSINIWDIRRPYIPFATFDEHKDVTTGIIWKYDPQIMLSASKDMTLSQHVLKDAKRPADHVVPVASDFSTKGDISFAASGKIMFENSVLPRPGAYSAARFPAFFRKGINPGEQFRNALSSCVIYQSGNEKNTFYDWFIESALKYQLAGAPFSEMCENNANVAQKLKRPIVAQTWRMLNVFYAPNPEKKHELEIGIDDASLLRSSRHNSGNTRHLSGSKGSNRHVSGNNTISDFHGETPISTDDDSDSTAENDNQQDLANIAAGQPSQNFFFGDGELNVDAGQKGINLDHGYGIPNEAFLPRTPVWDNVYGNHYFPETPGGDEEHLETEKINHIVKVNPELQPEVKIIEQQPPVPWQFSHHIANMLHCFTEEGDVQTAISMLLVLGEKINSHIKEDVLEQWFTGYIDLLHRFELWNIANQVIQLSPIANIFTLNQQSTTINNLCGNCKTRLKRCGWLCDKCKSSLHCSVCHQVVRGLYVWCQWCAHGGHVQHLMDWFEKKQICPSGCGHRCEYT